MGHEQEERKNPFSVHLRQKDILLGREGGEGIKKLLPPSKKGREGGREREGLHRSTGESFDTQSFLAISSSTSSHPPAIHTSTPFSLSSCSLSLLLWCHVSLVLSCVSRIEMKGDSAGK